MSTLFVHIGDVHLQAGHPRNADRLQALDQILDENLARPNLGAWLIPGDLFHQKSTAQDRNDLAERLTLMAAVAPIVLVRGNHDAPGDLDIFARLKAAWPVYVVTRPIVLTVPLPAGETAAIACVPYPDKFGLVAAGVTPGEVSQTAAELLDVIFMQLAHELSTLRVGGAIPLFLAHANLKGAIASTGQPQIGHEPEIDPVSLQRLPVVYCGLSHIHKPQRVGLGVYAGSIAAMDHGETEEKSYVLVDVGRLPSGDWHATWARQSVRTPRMFHIDGVLDRYGFSVDSRDEKDDVEIHRRIDERDWSGCDVRVRFSYRASEKSVLNESDARDLFAGALRLKIEAVAIPDRELRAPEVAAAKTLPEKLAAYRKVDQLEPSIAEKLARLQQQDSTTLLADVEREIAAIERTREEAMEAA
jgi:DNA repair exonuclease SbcCD nuclease subunit